MSDLKARLSRYRPAGRTIGEGRQFTKDCADALAAIERLESELAESRCRAERGMSAAEYCLRHHSDLAAKVATLKSLLRECEYHCPICAYGSDEGHTPDCRLDAALEDQ